MSLENAFTESPSHKATFNCINNCFKWELKADIMDDKIENSVLKSHVFCGKSSFYKELDKSILNHLHNIYNKYGCFDENTEESDNKCNLIKDNNSDLIRASDKKNTLTEDKKDNETNHNLIHNSDIKEPMHSSSSIFSHFLSKSTEKLMQLEAQKLTDSPGHNSIADVLHINFPINNTHFNDNIIDSNLGIKENLRDVFFVEFELKEEDWGFNDGGKEEKKGKKADNSKTKVDPNPQNAQIETQEISITKLNDSMVEKEVNFSLNGTYHGKKVFQKDIKFSVEFRKFIKSIQFRIINIQKIFDKVKNLETKKLFFSKVLTNANLGIEFQTPKIKDNKILTNFNSIVNMGIIIKRIFIELTLPKTYFNMGIFENVIKRETRDITAEKDANSPTSAPYLSPNNSAFSSPKKDCFYSPNSFTNYAKGRLYNSPSDFRKMFANHVSVRNNIKINSNYNPFLGSPVRYKPYYSPNGSVGFYSPGKMMGFAYNGYNAYMINSPLMMSPRSTNSETSYNFPYPPQSMYIYGQRKISESLHDKTQQNPLSNYNNNTTISNPLNNIETPSLIKDKILRKIKENKGKSKKNISISNSSISEEYEKMKFLFKNFSCERNNLDLFVEAITPKTINSDGGNKVRNILDVFSPFGDISLFGLKVIFLLEGELVRITYTVSLSNFYIRIMENNRTKEIKENIRKSNLCGMGIKVDSSEEWLVVNYNENTPYHSRPIFIEQIKRLFDSILLNNPISTTDLSLPDSYFSILFFPSSTLNRLNATSFLIFYTFDLKIYAILPIKFDSETFMNKHGTNKDFIEENIEKIRKLKGIFSYDLGYFVKWYEKNNM